MKTKKRVISIVLALVMVLATVMVPAVSAKADDDKTLIIKDNSRKYDAYQIFKGTLDGDILSNIAWGNGVDSDALLTDLKSATFSLGKIFSSCTTAEGVAKVLGDNRVSLTEDDMALFAKLVAANRTDKKSGSGAVDGDNYKISGLADGYYLVVDVSTLEKDDDALSRYLVDIPQTTVINDKREVPELDKKILEKDSSSDTVRVTANEASIGDRVEYELVTTVPDMTGYTAYYYVVNDTLSTGLTYNADMNIVFDAEGANTTLVKDTDYTVTPSGDTNIKIVFIDFLDNYKDAKGKKFTITYSATVDEDAVIGTTDGNTNVASLTFTNDPSYDYDGEKDEPGDDPEVPVGKTPDKETVTYVYGIKLLKVDGKNDSPLTGAKFGLAGSADFITKINSKIYERDDENGAFYKLKDGTYTADATDLTDDDCDGGLTAKYKEVTVVTKDTVKTKISKESYVDDEGIILFEGLGAGTYSLTELVAPEGYNSLTTPISIVIKANYNDPDNPTFTFVDQEGTETDVPDTGIIEWKVENHQGIVLPSTGGMGTTLFYVVGGVLVAFAGVLLITKKRMEKQ